LIHLKRRTSPATHVEVRPRRAHLHGGGGGDRQRSGTPYFCFNFLKRCCKDIVRNKEKGKSIEEQLREFEARLRRQALRERLAEDEQMQDSFAGGVTLGALAESRPASQVAGD